LATEGLRSKIGDLTQGLNQHKFWFMWVNDHISQTWNSSAMAGDDFPYEFTQIYVVPWANWFSFFWGTSSNGHQGDYGTAWRRWFYGLHSSHGIPYHVDIKPLLTMAYMSPVPTIWSFYCLKHRSPALLLGVTGEWPHKTSSFQHVVSDPKATPAFLGKLQICLLVKYISLCCISLYIYIDTHVYSNY